jgi:OOP family OmpA-OmpF porin
MDRGEDAARPWLVRGLGDVASEVGMKCNPFRWLKGLVLIAGVMGIMNLRDVPAQIEADLKSRAEAVLTASGITWTALHVSGRDIVLKGTAADDTEQRKALALTNAVWGIRKLEDRTALIDEEKNYVWSGSVRDTRLRLTGFVPNEASRRAVVGAAKATFPGHEFDDRMVLARGAPDLDVWLASIGFALKQLAGLKGGRVDLDGTQLAIRGEAESLAAYAAIKAALVNNLPPGIKVKDEKVLPPAARPYVWTAKRTGAELVLAGHIPSERARDELLASARKAFPGTIVTDRFELASGEPKDFQAATTVALHKLAQLEEGAAEAKDNQLHITGTAVGEDIAESVRRSLRADLPSTIKASDQIKVRDPDIRSAAPVGLSIALANGGVVVSGHVPSESARGVVAGVPGAADTRDSATATPPADRHQDALDRCQGQLNRAAQDAPINFDRGSAELDSRSRASLERIAQAAENCPLARIAIEGHTDAEGTPERNQSLSERRAEVIVEYLRRRGIGGERLISIGRGATRPLADNDTAENRAKNRRIEFAVSAN